MIDCLSGMSSTSSFPAVVAAAVVIVAAVEAGVVGAAEIDAAAFGSEFEAVGIAAQLAGFALPGWWGRMADWFHMMQESSS